MPLNLICLFIWLILNLSKTGGNIDACGREHINSGSRGDLAQQPYHQTGSNAKTIDAVRVDCSGLVSHMQIMKQQLASELQLPLRDLRLIDPSFPSHIQATFAARSKAILFTLENIKVLVKPEEAFVFGHTDHAAIKEFVPALQQQVESILSSDKKSSHAMRFEHVVIEAALNMVCGNLLQQVRALSPAIRLALQSLQAESKGLDIIKTQADQLLPLKNQLDELRKRVKEVDRAIKEVLDNDEDMLMMHLGLQSEQENSLQDTAAVFAADASTTSAEDSNEFPKPADVIFASNSIDAPMHSEQEPTAAALPDSSYASLDTDADSMHPWRQRRGFMQRILPHSSASSHSSNHVTNPAKSAGTSLRLLQLRRHIQHEDATISLEMMLENYLNEIGWISCEVEELLDQIGNTEENAALQIDLLRNRILRFELALSMSGFIVSCAALVTGLFGMNLLSHLELHPAMFWAVTAALAVGMLTSWGQLWRYGKHERLF